MTGDNSSADEKDTPIKGNVERVPAYATSLESSPQNRGLRDSQVVDPSAETPSRAAHAGHQAGADVLQDLGGERPDEFRPHRSCGSSYRTSIDWMMIQCRLPRLIVLIPWSVPSVVKPANTWSVARQEVNEANFTKGENAPTVDRSRYPYTVEEMDAHAE